MMSVISRNKVLEKIFHDNVGFKIVTESHFRELIIVEYLRKSLYNLSRRLDQQYISQPVFITRLLNSVRNQLKPLWPDFLNQDNSLNRTDNTYKGEERADPVKLLLDKLSLIGDVIEVGNGYWLPTPVRLIRTPLDDKILIVGGLSTADLRVMLGTEIKICGYVRYAELSGIPESIIRDESLWQLYENWIGDIPVNISEWTKLILNRAKLNLRSSASNFENFEVYIPIKAVNKHYYRWISSSSLNEVSGKVNDDLILCRLKSNNSSVKYLLGIVGLDGLRKEVPVPIRSVRRLMYGLDLLYNAPTRAVWESGGTINLYNLLPKEELRLAVSIGVDVSPKPGKFPIRFMFEPEWQEIISNTLLKLGVQVDGGIINDN